jgi:hypothetical protein
MYAVIGRTLAEHFATNRRAADPAGCALAIVDVQRELEITRAPVATHVVPQCRASLPERVLQYCPHRIDEDSEAAV